MKIGKLHTYWVALLSILSTAKYASYCICKGFLKSNNRPWVDATLNKWSDNLLKLIDVKCTVVNPYHVEPELGKATIIMCNHTSIYDIPLSFKVFPEHSIRMLAKKELFKIPFLGGGMKAAEFPFIDRKNKLQAIKDLEYAKELMESGIIIWVAPEGTRSKNGKLAPFKKGAFVTAIQAKATIIPIGIRGADDILPAQSMQLNLHQKAEIHVGKPIDAAQFDLKDKQDLVNLTHKAIKMLVG